MMLDKIQIIKVENLPKGRVVGVRLDTKRLLGNQLDDGGVSGLDELGRWLHYLTRTTVFISAQAHTESGQD
jgi:hypothetical protein